MKTLFSLISLFNFIEALPGLRGIEGMKEYKFFRIKGCLHVLGIICNFDSIRYTDIEVGYIKEKGEKLAPGTLTRCLRELEKNGLIRKENGRYKATQKGKDLLNYIKKLLPTNQ